MSRSLMPGRRGLQGVAVALGLATLSLTAHSQPVLTDVQDLYLERCGGCHGLQGVSAPREVPTLRGQAGYFLCTPRGRGYLVRLPSLATAPIDDALLAALVNFVAFDLGGGEARYPRYTAAEVAQLRSKPLTEESLSRYRSETVEELIAHCGAPRALRAYAGAFPP
jgi:hypothetical protein